MASVTCSAAALAIHQEINRTATPYPRDSSMVERFEHHAVRRPGAPAAVQGDREVSYHELNRLANGLARALQNEGIGPGATVGICVPRSPEMLVALLGILKCGGTFVPLDRDWPAERFRHVVADADCKWVISDRPEELAQRFDGRLLPLDERTLTACDTNPPHASTAESIACIYYTSGSTGRPKGVPILHRGINRTAFFTAFGPVDERSRILQLGSLTFDMATSEIWGALLSGGTSVLYPAEPVRLSRLAEVIRTGRVNLVALPTSLFNLIVDEAPEILEPVATMTIGGEAQSHRHMAKALRAYGPGRVFNLYGPTESTCVATCYSVDDLPRDDMPFPIGRPLQNTRLYVLADDTQRLCEPGETGELCLAGDGLAAGYLGLAELTRKHFIHRDIAGVRERLYRTGDRGFLLSSGDVVFAGRQDEQVKLNGFRVELGEVRHHLDGHPAVKRSFVMVSDGDDHRSLVAFVIPNDTDITEQDLREHLVTTLPRYMVPARIHLRGDLPLTSHGKVDRQALHASREPRPNQGVRPHA